jgi:uncharacterized protein YsxB (DUF464 family)
VPGGAVITITVRAARSRVAELVVTGHAGQAPAGSDVVCAGVSALVETLRIGLEQVVPGGTADVRPGRARFTFGEDPAQQAVVATIVAGLADLARTYPEWIRMVRVTKVRDGGAGLRVSEGGGHRGTAAVCP